MKVHFFVIVKYIAKNYQNLTYTLKESRAKKPPITCFLILSHTKNKTPFSNKIKTLQVSRNWYDQTILHKVIISSSIISLSTIQKSTFVPFSSHSFSTIFFCISTNQRKLSIIYTEIKIPKTTIANWIQHWKDCFFQLLKPSKWKKNKHSSN